MCVDIGCMCLWVYELLFGDYSGNCDNEEPALCVRGQHTCLCALPLSLCLLISWEAEVGVTCWSGLSPFILTTYWKCTGWNKANRNNMLIFYFIPQSKWNLGPFQWMSFNNSSQLPVRYWHKANLTLGEPGDTRSNYASPATWPLCWLSGALLKSKLPEWVKGWGGHFFPSHLAVDYLRLLG